MSVKMKVERVQRPEIGATGVVIFSPVSAIPSAPRLLLERDAKENLLGPSGWTVTSEGVAPQEVEFLGTELRLYIGPPIAKHVKPGTPIKVRVAGTDLTGEVIWPPIAQILRTATQVVVDRGPSSEERPARIGDAGTMPPATMPPAGDSSGKQLAHTAGLNDSAGTPASGVGLTRGGGELEPITRLRPEEGKGGQGPHEYTGKGEGKPEGSGRKAMIFGGAVLAGLLLLGGAAALLLLQKAGREEPRLAEALQPPERPAAVPSQTQGTELPNPCLSPSVAITAACPPERLADLPPAGQVTLAEGLLRQGGSPSNGLALALLTTVASRHRDPAAMLQLARMNDPATFQPGGPVTAPNPLRALDLYKEVAAAGIAEAQRGADALIAALRREATAEGPNGARARDILRKSGVE